MPGLGGLAGLSGAYSGYNQGVSEEATARAKKYAIDLQQASDAAFGRTLEAFNSQQPQPGQAGGKEPILRLLAANSGFGREFAGSAHRLAGRLGAGIASCRALDPHRSHEASSTIQRHSLA